MDSEVSPSGEVAVKFHLCEAQTSLRSNFTMHYTISLLRKQKLHKQRERSNFSLFVYLDLFTRSLSFPARRAFSITRSVISVPAISTKERLMSLTSLLTFLPIRKS